MHQSNLLLRELMTYNTVIKSPQFIHSGETDSMTLSDDKATVMRVAISILLPVFWLPSRLSSAAIQSKLKAVKTARSIRLEKNTNI